MDKPVPDGEDWTIDDSDSAMIEGSELARELEELFGEEAPGA